MNKKFEHFGIYWDPRCCLPPINDLRSEDEKKHFHTTMSSINTVIQRFDPLRLMLGAELAKQQFIFEKSKVSIATVMLTTDPKRHAYFTPKSNLCADISYNPLDLASLPKRHAEIGRLAIELSERGLQKFSELAEFPADFCRSVLRKFEEADYTFSWEIGIRSIRTTKTRISIFGTVNGGRTVCTLVVAREEDVIFRQEIWSVDDAKWQFANRFKALSVLDGELIVGSPTDRLVGPCNIPVDELPLDVVDAIISKTGQLKS